MVCRFRTRDGHIGLRVAVADGATQAHRSREWASQLVAGYAAGRISPTATITTIRSQIPSFPIEEPRSGSWVDQGRALLGSFATLTGVTITYKGGWRFDALSIGDTCVFVTNADGRIRRTFPYRSAKDFSKAPVMVGSARSANAAIPNIGIRSRGRLGPGDVVWVATDELAGWILRQSFRVRSPLAQLERHLKTHQDFESFIAEIRDQNQVNDDDMTIVRVSRR